MTSPRIRARLRATATPILCLALIGTACASGTAGKTVPTPPSTATDTTQVDQLDTPVNEPPTTAAVTQTTVADGGSVASVTFSDAAGDAVAVTLTLGQVVPAASVQNAAVRACSDGLQRAGSSTARSAAIPVTVTARLQSDSPVPMTMDLLSALSEVFDSAAFQVFTGELLSPQAQQTLPDNAQDAIRMFWATSHSDTGPECVRASDGDGGTWASATWSSLTPGAPTTWQSWLVIPEQLTPNSPGLTSPYSQANWFLFQPIVTIGQTHATTAYASPRTSVVNCGWPAGAQGTTIPLYLAVNPTVAVARGCKSDA